MPSEARDFRAGVCCRVARLEEAMRRLSSKFRVKKRLNVPIYNATVWIVVSDKPKAEREKMSKIFGALPSDFGELSAACSSNNEGTFAMFFAPQNLVRRTIAHEVFHLTHRILEWVGAAVDKDNHEPAAYLCGWLTERVYEIAMGEKQ